MAKTASVVLTQNLSDTQRTTSSNHSTNDDAIPTIDYSMLICSNDPDQQLKALQYLAYVCEEYGFFYVWNFLSSLHIHSFPHSTPFCLLQCLKTRSLCARTHTHTCIELQLWTCWHTTQCWSLCKDVKYCPTSKKLRNFTHYLRWLLTY